MNIISEQHIDDLLNSIDEIHIDELDLESLTEEEYQAYLDQKYEDWEAEESEFNNNNSTE